MRMYKFLAQMEPDEEGWFVRCPAMERYGGFAGGDTKEEAWNLIQEILRANIETMLELGMPVPEEPENPVSLDENQALITVEAKLEPSSQEGYSQKTYRFRAVVEPDEDQWTAYCPTLKKQGAATGGQTWEEAYINIHQVLRMTLESMILHGETIPVDVPSPSDEVIAVTV